MEKEKNYVDVFDIVVAPFHSLNGDVMKYPDSEKAQFGLFMVADVSYGNALCFKITSNEDYKTNATVKLKKTDHLFLMTDSYLQTNRPHTLDPKICRKIGSISQNVRLAVIKKMTQSLSRIIEGMNQKVGFVYVSPNKKAKEPSKGDKNETV